jgi:hypothetical protein
LRTRRSDHCSIESKRGESAACGNGGESEGARPRPSEAAGSNGQSQFGPCTECNLKCDRRPTPSSKVSSVSDSVTMTRFSGGAMRGGLRVDKHQIKWRLPFRVGFPFPQRNEQPKSQLCRSSWCAQRGGCMRTHAWASIGTWFRGQTQGQGGESGRFGTEPGIGSRTCSSARWSRAVTSRLSIPASRQGWVTVAVRR